MFTTQTNIHYNTTSWYDNVLIKKMLNVVGADQEKFFYDPEQPEIDFKSEGWFRLYNWSRAQENEFVEWMADLLYNDIKLRKEFCAHPKKNKIHCKKVAREFVDTYGWVIDG